MAHEILPNITSINRLLWLGCGLALLGVLCVLSPLIAGDAWSFAVGAILLVAAIAKLRAGLQPGTGNNRLLTAILGTITMIGAVIVIAHPILGLGTLTALLVVYFAADGFWKIIQSMRYMSAPGWSWLLASGIVSWLLGFFIWRQWPISGNTAAAILVGTNLISTGVALVGFASSLKGTFQNLLSNLQSRGA